MKSCKIENCSSPVWGKGVCKFHTTKKRIKKNPSKKDFSPMRDFFFSIWNERAHLSELSGEPLGNEALSIFFHHIIPKRDERFGKIAMYDRENVILLTFAEHQQVENDMYRYEEINKRREKLLKKYEKERN